MVEITKSGSKYMVSDDNMFVSCATLDRAEYIKDHFYDEVDRMAKRDGLYDKN